MAKGKKSTKKVRQLADGELTPAEIAAGKTNMNNAGGGSSPAKDHIMTEEAHSFVTGVNGRGFRSRFGGQRFWETLHVRVAFLRKEKGDVKYQLTQGDLDELYFTEDLEEGVVDAFDGKPLAEGDNVVALIVIPPTRRDGTPNSNAGDLLRDRDGGAPKTRGLSLTLRKKGEGRQPLEAVSFSNRNRKVAEGIANDLGQYLTSRAAAEARAKAINASENAVNAFKESRGIGSARGGGGFNNSPHRATAGRQGRGWRR